MDPRKLLALLLLTLAFSDLGVADIEVGDPAVTTFLGERGPGEVDGSVEEVPTSTERPEGILTTVTPDDENVDVPDDDWESTESPEDISPTVIPVYVDVDIPGEIPDDGDEKKIKVKFPKKKPPKLPVPTPVQKPKPKPRPNPRPIPLPRPNPRPVFRPVYRPIYRPISWGGWRGKRSENLSLKRHAKVASFLPVEEERDDELGHDLDLDLERRLIWPPVPKPVKPVPRPIPIKLPILWGGRRRNQSWFRCQEACESIARKP